MNHKSRSTETPFMSLRPSFVAFDPEFYLSNNPEIIFDSTIDSLESFLDPFESAASAFAHYVFVGSDEGLAPNVRESFVQEGDEFLDVFVEDLFEPGGVDGIVKGIDDIGFVTFRPVTPFATEFTTVFVVGGVSEVQTIDDFQGVPQLLEFGLSFASTPSLTAGARFETYLLQINGFGALVAFAVNTQQTKLFVATAVNTNGFPTFNLALVTIAATVGTAFQNSGTIDLATDIVLI